MTVKILNTFQTNPYHKTLKFVGRVAKECILTKDDIVRGNNIKNDIIKMGPTYIKVGQLISTRTDIFPKYITNTFSDLQNGIEHMPFEQVNEIFKNDFNKDINHFFKHFSKKPLAAASMGQVHVATLHQFPNKILAVKVIREDVDQTFKEELIAIIKITMVLQFFAKLLKLNQNFNDVMSLLQEQYNNIESETNMHIERKNMIIFQKLLSNKSSRIITPRACKSVYSKNVLTMEYLPSNKITMSNNNVDSNLIANELMRSFVLMVINDGFLHCDPHPGNLGINKKGQIVMYDFGLVKKFDLNIKESFRKVFFALINQSSTEMIEFMLSSKIIIAKESKGNSIEMLTGHEIIILQRIVQYVYVYMNDLDVFSFITSIKNDKYIELDNIPFDFDVQLVYIFKSFSTLEGVCKQLNASFNYIDLLSELVFDILDIEMLIDKATYDIRKSSYNTASTTSSRINNDTYTKFAFERLNKRFDNQSQILIGIIFFITFIDVLIIIL
jgi:predicted unusual protein kinase regulating ubiquinone biosynthesis (AarF/ABC1/UbiB family)